MASQTGYQVSPLNKKINSILQQAFYTGVLRESLFFNLTKAFILSVTVELYFIQRTSELCLNFVSIPRNSSDI